MTHSFRLTARPRKDLVSIGCCTSKRWGKAQRDRYLAALDDRFRGLAENPRVGRARPEIGNDVYSSREGAHVVFHVVRETGIELVGVPHQAMAFVTHLAKGHW
jgi:toxin ParE1/3/4